MNKNRNYYFIKHVYINGVFWKKKKILIPNNLFVLQNLLLLFQTDVVMYGAIKGITNEFSSYVFCLQ